MVVRSCRSWIKINDHVLINKSRHTINSMCHNKSIGVIGPNYIAQYECRMSNVEYGQKTPWTLSEVPSAPIWYSPVREKRKNGEMKGNQIWEKISAHTENSLSTYWLSRKRALCVTCKKADPAETNLSRASRVRQDSQFHIVDKGDILFEWKILYRARILRSGGRSWPRRTRKLLA